MKFDWNWANNGQKSKTGDSFLLLYLYTQTHSPWLPELSRETISHPAWAQELLVFLSVFSVPSLKMGTAQILFFANCFIIFCVLIYSTCKYSTPRFAVTSCRHWPWPLHPILWIGQLEVKSLGLFLGTLHIASAVQE